MKFYDVLTLFLFGTHWSSPRMDFCRNIQRADIDSLNQDGRTCTFRQRFLRDYIIDNNF